MVKAHYEILEDERLGDYQLPKLVLQPLVENAIYHGIKEIDRPGLIRVTTEVSGDYACVSIFDNGRGFDRSVINSPNPSSFRRCWLEKCGPTIASSIWRSLSYGD